jgi:hypothetical protein
MPRTPIQRINTTKMMRNMKVNGRQISAVVLVSIIIRMDQDMREIG